MSFLGIRVNGNLLDFSSVEVAFNGVPYQTITEINYGTTRSIGKLWGNSAFQRGSTRGREEPTCTFSMYKEDAKAFRAQILGSGIGGYGENRFITTIKCFEVGAVPTIDKLLGCKIVGDEDSHSSSEEVLVTQFTLDVVRYLPDGMPMTGGLADLGNLISGGNL